MTRSTLLSKSYKSEDAFQADIIRFWNTQLYCLRAILFHVPNQATYENSKYLAMGVKAGIPDLVLLLPNGKTMFIELKLPNGKVKPEQTRIHQCLSILQHPIAVIHTPAELFNLLDPVLAYLDTLPAWNPVAPCSYPVNPAVDAS